MPIHNHQAPTLSKLDLEIMSHVKPGGNWKSVPKGMSKRIDNMEGGRTTQYGRLLPDRPSYTISTYYPRPGNGCHFHWSQERTLTHREAARLQSFPDSVAFGGSNRAIAMQIGNAVPPLLAYQLATEVGPPGSVCDLFCGAGGMSRGFRWAGWTTTLAVDIMPDCRTAQSDIPGVFMNLDISKNYAQIVAEAIHWRDTSPRPFVVLGGPPCQGHSTAGKRAGVDDPRNHLVVPYLSFLEDTEADGFVMENVLGIRTSAGGRFLGEVMERASHLGYEVECHEMDASRYGVPQRRKRVFVCGMKGRSWPRPRELFRDGEAISVASALSDLPPVTAGEDGSGLGYLCDPASTYQLFARGNITPQTYLMCLGGWPQYQQHRL